MVIALIREATRQNTMVKPRGLNICPVIPSSNASGINTTQVVAVPPIIDWSTTPLPFKAASRYPTSPFPSVERKQLSRTTMELSTIIPTPSTRDERVTTFKVKPIALIAINVARIEIGIEVPTIRDALISPKNRKIIIMEIITAITMVSITLFKDA